MLDKHGRDINYMRISLTDRCNLRCRYCMPESGIDNLSHNTILSLEEIARLVRIASELGIKKIRLTGGEPLVRRNISQLIGYIAQVPGIDDIALTTNGILFAELAEELKAAGLNRVNFSLDSLVPEKFNYITRRGELERVKKAIFKALELDMHPVKINTVVIRGFNDDEIIDFVELARKYPLHIRFIEFMPVGDLLFWKPERMMPSQDIQDLIEESYTLTPRNNIQGNGPAQYYSPEGGEGTLGFISPMSNHFCGECNRIRLTAEGGLRGCLYDKREVNIKTALKNGFSDEKIKELFTWAIKSKPARHNMNEGWGEGNKRKMYQIGG